MPARLILNADDFGLTPGINRAIAELHLAGVLTSATLMATGPAFADAVALAHTLPALGVGCHIVLVDGTPASPPEEIPTLLAPNRRAFHPTLAAFLRNLHRIDPADITREAAAQLARLRRHGIPVTHVDTHKHTHCLPAVARALLQLPDLPAIRYPFEPLFARQASRPGLLRELQQAALNRFEPTFRRLAAHTRIPTRTTNGTLGIAATGTLTPETLRDLLAALPPTGTFELCCHPGYNDADLDQIPTRLRAHRDHERLALLNEIPRLPTLPHPPNLIHYGHLP